MTIANTLAYYGTELPSMFYNTLPRRRSSDQDFTEKIDILNVLAEVKSYT
jgi:hypothetical protein